MLSDLIQSDLEAQAAELVQEHVQGFGDARSGHRVSLNDGFVGLGPSVDIVGLHGKNLLEGIGGAISLEGPHFHFAETLATERACILSSTI